MWVPSPLCSWLSFTHTTSFIINVKAKSVWDVTNKVESIIKRSIFFLEVLSVNCLSILSSNTSSIFITSCILELHLFKVPLFRSSSSCSRFILLLLQSYDFPNITDTQEQYSPISTICQLSMMFLKGLVCTKGQVPKCTLRAVAMLILQSLLTIRDTEFHAGCNMSDRLWQLDLVRWRLSIYGLQAYPHVHLPHSSSLLKVHHQITLGGGIKMTVWTLNLEWSVIPYVVVCLSVSWHKQCWFMSTEHTQIPSYVNIHCAFVRPQLVCSYPHELICLAMWCSTEL